MKYILVTFLLVLSACGQDGTNGTNGATGATGMQGPAGIDPNAIVAVFSPCPTNTSAYREVLLILNTGQIVSSFSDDFAGDSTRFTLLPDGSYIDTDNSGCNFTVSTDSINHLRIISYPGGSQSWPNK